MSSLIRSRRRAHRSRLSINRIAPPALAALALGTFATATVAALDGTAVAHGSRQATSAAQTVKVDVRVEGLRSTLLAERTIAVHAQNVDPDGKPADTCGGITAAAALQQATHGRWQAGKYYSGLGYSVEGILGESHPFSSSYYWSFWLNDKTATVGICGATLHAGDRLLFFAQCSKESAGECPQGRFDPPVLAISGPHRARVGRTVDVTVSSIDNTSGKSTPAAGAKLHANGQSVSASTGGVAKLRFRKPGRYEVRASAPGAVPDELPVLVSR